MSEYITKEQALEAFEKAEAESLSAGFSRLNLFGHFSLELASIQTDDVAPIARCEWIESEYSSYICSACGIEWMLDDGTPEVRYCPNCGAKLEVAR